MDRERIRKRSETLLKRLVDHAVFVRAVDGKGRLGKVDSLLGRAQGYCARVLGNEIGGVDLGEFLGMLVALEVDVEQFFADALRFHPQRYLWQVEGTSPNEVRYLKRTLHWASKECTPLAVETARERIPELEGRRMLERAKVKQECIRALGVLSQQGDSAEFLELRCEAFGVLGAICRAQGSLSAAAFSLREALVLATRLSSEDAEAGEKAKARALQRVGCLLADLGKLEEALDLAKSARTLYKRLGNDHGVGKTLVDSGTFLSMLGRLEEAVEDFETSLEHLPESDWRYRFSAFQGLGVCHSELHRSEPALSFLRKALVEVRGRGLEAMAQWLLWLRGRIRCREEQWALAEDDFRAVQAIQLTESGNPLNLALVSLELARTLLVQGKLESLGQLTQEIIPVMGRLQSNPILTAAMEEYVLTALRGEVSIQTIEETLRTLRDASETETPLQDLCSLNG